MKKLISFLLAAACLFASFQIGFAEGEEAAQPTRQEAAINLLYDIGVITGSIPAADASMTRADFAPLAARMLGAGDMSGRTASKRIYADVAVDHPAAASIEYLFDAGVMIGNGQASFGPDGNLLYEEAVKVAVSMIGYADLAELNGGYPSGYFASAASNNLLKGVTGKVGETISSGQIAVLMQNVLENKNYLSIKEIANGRPIYDSSNEDNYMNHILGIYSYTGIVTGFGDTSLAGDLEYPESQCAIGDNIFEIGEVNVSQYLGMQVKAYYREIDGDYVLCHVEATNKNNVLEIQARDILPDTTTDHIKYDNGKTTRTAKVAGGAVYIYNGKKISVVLDGDMQPEIGNLRLIDYDNNGSYDIVMINSFENYIVEKASVSDEKIYFKYDQGSLALSADDGVNAKYFMDGASTEFSSLSNGSVVSIKKSRVINGPQYIEVYISNNKVTSSATSISMTEGEEKITLEDGTEYSVSPEYIKRVNNETGGSYFPQVGNSGVFYIDYFGSIAGYVLEVGGRNYGYITKAYYDDAEEKAFIKMFTKNAEFITFEVSEKVKYNNAPLKNAATVALGTAEDGTAGGSDLARLPALLKQTGDEADAVYQLIVYKANSENVITSIQTAANKTDANPVPDTDAELNVNSFYIASERDFVLNYISKYNTETKRYAGLRFYKNMAEYQPYYYADGQTIQFMIPSDKTNEKDFKIATKPTSTDVSLAGPVRIFDAGPGGVIGAITSGTSNDGKYGTPGVIESINDVLDEEDEPCKEIVFAGGSSVTLASDVRFTQPETTDAKGSINWCGKVPDYGNYTLDDLKRGDTVTYTMLDGKVDNLRVLVKSDNIGPSRVDGDHIQESGNIVGTVISVAENGKTVTIYFDDRYGDARYQTMLVNSTTYKYDSDKDKIEFSSAADMRPGDKILINSYWWSPKLVVIYK